MLALFSRLTHSRLVTTVSSLNHTEKLYYRFLCVCQDPGITSPNHIVTVSRVLHEPLLLIHSPGLHTPRPRGSCLQGAVEIEIELCTGVCLHLHLRPFWYRMKGEWEEKGYRLPTGRGSRAQRFGVSLTEGIHLSAHLEPIHSAPVYYGRPIWKLRTKHFLL